jgi:hypothetical protein
VKKALIVDLEAIAGIRQAEVSAAKRIIKRGYDGSHILLLRKLIAGHQLWLGRHAGLAGQRTRHWGQNARVRDCASSSARGSLSRPRSFQRHR